MSHGEPRDPRRHQHHAAPEAEAEAAAMAELLDLDAEVLHPYLSGVTAWIRELAADQPLRRILDLGCGTGTGTFALLERFGDAEVTALDLSPALLHRLRDRARQLGVADRVRAVKGDLDAPWPEAGPVDLVWASFSLHHLADPDRALARAFAVLRPGGLLAVIEMDSFPRFLPDDVGLGRPGLEARGHAALAAGHAQELPHFGSDWGPRLARAGFRTEAERPFVIELTPPLPAAAGRYARACLQRMRSGLAGQLSADDLAALDTLVDSDGPDGLLRRDDLSVRATRTAWVARRA